MLFTTNWIFKFMFFVVDSYDANDEKVKIHFGNLTDCVVSFTTTDYNTRDPRYFVNKQTNSPTNRGLKLFHLEKSS